MITLGEDANSPDGFRSICTGHLATDAVVVFNLNGADDALAYLDSVAALTYPNLNVNMVDNGLADESMAHTVKPKPLALQLPLHICHKSYYGKHLELRICT